MNLTITGHQIVVTPAITASIESALARIDARISDSTRVTVRIAGKRKNGNVPSLKIEMRFPGKRVLEVTQYLSRTMYDFYTAIKVAFERLERLLERTSAKADKTHHRTRVAVRKERQLAFA